jgi:hypothetical protein
MLKKKRHQESLRDRDPDIYVGYFANAFGEQWIFTPRIALRANAELTAGDVQELRLRLERLDAHSKVGPWTTSVLRLIARHPELRATELAARSSFEKEWLKLNIRKLKNLGLTESLAVGYRLSPRGAALLTMMQDE